MTSSKIEMPGEVKADPAALMASLHLLPSPTLNLEIKYTKVSCVRLFWQGNSWLSLQKEGFCLNQFDSAITNLSAEIKTTKRLP